VPRRTLGVRLLAIESISQRCRTERDGVGQVLDGFRGRV
jgi:hypothetical protein